MRHVTEIIVHCSATRPEWMGTAPTADKVREIRRWHVSDRGWKDIGYHYLIDRNGTVATGRPVEQVGAHVQGHNTGTIGVCLIGGHGSSETDRFDQHFTAAQDKSLRTLLADLKRKFPGVSKITGHNQYAAKACPGFDVGAWYVAKPATAPVKPAPQSGKPAPAQPSPAKPATGLLALLWRAFMALFKGWKP
jgi:N-acetylmuramoyl-L-alanine amidase